MKQVSHRKLRYIAASTVIMFIAVLVYAKSQGPHYECQPLGDPAFGCGYWEYVEYLIGFNLLALASMLPAIVVVAIPVLLYKHSKRKSRD